MNFIFHIGLHKTGTTFLQKEVFPKLENLHVVQQSHNIRRLFGVPKEKRVLVTHEGLSGNPFGGAWLEEFESYVRGITSIFPDAACIIGFRRHDLLIRSLYKQYLQEGGTRGLEVLFSVDGSGRIKTKDLSYRHRLEFIRKHFSSVHLYAQEQMKNKPDSSLNSLLHFLDINCACKENIEKNTHNVGVKKSYRLKRSDC